MSLDIRQLASSTGRVEIKLQTVLPAIGLVLILIAIVNREPAVVSYFGINLLLAYAMPLILASMAQLCVIVAGDIDLGIGAFVSLVACIAAHWLSSTPWLGILGILAGILAYAGLGALIHLRRLPSIVATLGASFVWLGLALTLSPVPGGAAPSWLTGFVRLQPPAIPLPVVIAIVVAFVGHLLLMHTAYGAVLRGIGGNAQAIARAGWSRLWARIALYGMAGIFGTLGGLVIGGLTTTGDAYVGANYTLQSIAAVIIGGSEFVGGVVSPLGAVVGALIMLLIGSLLSFASISPNWQLSVQGVVLIMVLSLRRLSSRRRA